MSFQILSADKLWDWRLVPAAAKQHLALTPSEGLELSSPRPVLNACRIRALQEESRSLGRIRPLQPGQGVDKAWNSQNILVPGDREAFECRASCADVRGWTRALMRMGG